MEIAGICLQTVYRISQQAKNGFNKGFLGILRGFKSPLPDTEQNLPQRKAL
jgi:hypothetical protein